MPEYGDNLPEVLKSVLYEPADDSSSVKLTFICYASASTINELKKVLDVINLPEEITRVDISYTSVKSDIIGPCEMYR